MASKESGQCPHFNITDGVCGCPEFWRPVQGSQHGRSSTALQQTSSESYSQSAPSRQVSSNVNSIPLPDRNKIQQVTPAPCGPPKETCFFWYHGSCRRGDKCGRPHEAHPTWPIPPPPGFRHYQPCTLPLCPLRSDFAAVGNRRRRTIDGQMDGAAFSRTTTASESFSDKDTITNTDADMSEAIEDTYVTLDKEILGLSTGGSQGSADKGGAEGAAHTSKVKEQRLGRNGFGEFDYVDYIDLSQSLPPFPPSTPLVQEETLLSISHPGTLSKCRHSPASSSRSNNNCVKLEEVSATELDNVISLFERPRKVSQWDVKPRSRDGQHSEPSALYFAAFHNLPTQRSTELGVSNNRIRKNVPPPSDPPKGPRGMGTPPLICFFFYHKGYCRPKNGRRCDYLHDSKTAQQIVSLPHGIDDHDPSCSLPHCPIRLRRAGQVKQEEDLLASQPEINYEPPTSARIDPSPFYEVVDSSQHGLPTSVRSRPTGQMISRPLPQLTGLAKKQKTCIEQLQTTGSIGSAEAASAIESIQQRQTERQKKRKKRGKKKNALVSCAEGLRFLNQGQEAVQQDLDSRSGTLSMQQPLPSLPLAGTSAPTAQPSLSGQKKWKLRQRNKNKLRNQYAESLRLGRPLEDESILEVTLTQEALQHSDVPRHLPGLHYLPQGVDHPVIDISNQVSKRGALHMKDRTDYGPRACHPSTTQHQQVSSHENVPYEYPQETLGLSSAKRRAYMLAEQQRRGTWIERQSIVREETRVARDERATLVASVSSADPSHQHDAGYDGSIDRPRCHGCWVMKKNRDCTNEAGPCLRCKDAGYSAEGFVDWRPDDSSIASRYKSLVDYQLPEGDQRLDWDTDLVRRLFGEIE